MSLKFRLIFHWNVNWIFNGFPLVNHWSFYRISTGYPIDFNWYCIEISTGFLMYFHWYSLIFQLDFQLVSIGISLKFQLVFYRNSTGIQLIFITLKIPIEFFISNFQLDFQYPISNWISHTTHLFLKKNCIDKTLPEAQRTQGIASKLKLSLQQNRMPLAFVKNLANM